MATATGRAFVARLGIAALYHTAGTIPPLQLAAGIPFQPQLGHTGSYTAADCFLLPPSLTLLSLFAGSRSLSQVAARF